MCPFLFFRSHLLSIKKRTFYPSTYRKIPEISTRACILQRPSLKGLCTEGAYIRRSDLREGFLWYESRGLIFGGAYTWRGLFSKFYSS